MRNTTLPMAQMGAEIDTTEMIVLWHVAAGF
jgi:hypothetical protein